MKENFRAIRTVFLEKNEKMFWKKRENLNLP